MEFIRLQTKIFKPNFDLFSGIIEALLKNKQKLEEKDILIVNSKIVAVSQGRVVKISDVKISPVKNKKRNERKSHYGKGVEDPQFVALVEEEADVMAPGPMLLTIKNGIFTPAAGIDRSNSPKGIATLWPENAWGVAWYLYQNLRSHFSLKNIGVVIVDSTCQPLRVGTSGVALAWAGFEGVEDVRGKKDIYKKPLTVTKKAIADNLACAAQILMGEAAEKVPLVLIKKSPVKFSQKKPNPPDAHVAPKDCLYSGLYGNIRDIL